MVIPLDGIMSEFRAVAVRPAEHFETGILRRLLRMKLVECREFATRGTLTLTGPLAVVRPGDRMPDCDVLAWLAQRRLPPVQEVSVVRSSQRGCNIFGGEVVDWNRLQLYHELIKASAFMAWKRAGRQVDLWVGEHRFGKHARLLPKVPDAIVITEPLTIVEAIGDYPASRIREFLEAFDGYGLEIELW